jgi:hypothetical protein
MICAPPSALFSATNGMARCLNGASSWRADVHSLDPRIDLRISVRNWIGAWARLHVLPAFSDEDTKRDHLIPI